MAGNLLGRGGGWGRDFCSSPSSSSRTAVAALVGARGRSNPLNAAERPVLFKQRKNLESVSVWSKVGSGELTVVLYGEDEPGPRAGDERPGEGAQSGPFGQWGQQRIMGREGRVWPRPLGPHHQAKASKSSTFLSGMLYIRPCLRRIACEFLCSLLGERSKDPFTVDLFWPAPVLLPFSGWLLTRRCLGRACATASTHQRGWVACLEGWDKVRGCQAPHSLVSHSHHDLLLACEGPFKTQAKCHLTVQITNLHIYIEGQTNWNSFCWASEKVNSKMVEGVQTSRLTFQNVFLCFWRWS